MLRRLIDMMLRRPSPPHDERSIRAEQLSKLAKDVHDTTDRVDGLVPSRLRTEARMAERRLRHS